MTPDKITKLRENNFQVKKIVKSTLKIILLASTLGLLIACGGGAAKVSATALATSDFGIQHPQKSMVETAS